MNLVITIDDLKANYPNIFNNPKHPDGFACHVHFNTYHLIRLAGIFKDRIAATTEQGRIDAVKDALIEFYNTHRNKCEVIKDYPDEDWPKGFFFRTHPRI
jgi:uncharacterized protein YutD